MIQVGLMVEGQAGLTWTRWRRLLEAAEGLGFPYVFRSDHFISAEPGRESLEAWISLTYAATCTQRIEFGTLVTPITFRHPSLIARMASSIDDLSGGRLVLGMGMGWNAREHRQFGIPFPPPSTRRAMLEDGLEIITRLLRNSEPVTCRGAHFSTEDAVLVPPPQRRGGPPILIGGNGPKFTLPLAARYADEWNADFLSPSDYRERNLLLNDLLNEVGRDPSSVRRSLMTQLIFARSDAEFRDKLARDPKLETKLAEDIRIVGTPTQVVDRIGVYADAGVQRFMLQWLDLDDLDGLESFAQTVLPQVSAIREG